MSNCVISTVVLALFVLSSEAVGEREEKKPGGALVKPAHVVAIQREAEDSGKGRYDWGPSVMRDGELYKMWWVRLGGGNKKRFPYSATLPDGEVFSFTYPDWGDRVYYAESRDGLKWNIAGEDYAGPVDQFGPDAPGPMMVLKPAESEQEKNHLGNPSVIKVNDTYYMYYETCCEYDVKRDASGKVVVGNEYHNQVFVATSRDGRTWRKHPDDANPQPIVEAPEANRLERKRYGFGQPSVFYKDGTFVMHYVNSCTGPGDFMVRIEADNPFFRDAKVFRHRLMAPKGWPAAPAGAVARFAQTDIQYLGKSYLLVRPAYGTGNLNVMVSRTGLFPADAGATEPAKVFPQLVLIDPRGEQYKTRLYPHFLTEPQGQVIVTDGKIAIYYTSGLGFKDKAYTWDLYCCDVPVSEIEKACRQKILN